MKKVVYLPLDERPCNFRFPSMISKNCKDIDFIVPDIELLGKKKIPANYNDIKDYLLKNCSNADYLILSLDMLVYGGIVPSRLHNTDIDTLTERLQIIKQIKENNNNLKIYGFSLIMRCPQYSSDDEEPSYYERCGREIFLLGEILDKKQNGIIVDENEIIRLKSVTSDCIDDFINRRNKNLEINKKIIDLVKKYIDFLIIPQDDSSVYGYTAIDQSIIRNKIKEEKLFTKVYMYPGADEVGMTLLSRVLNDIKGITPRVSVEYSSINGASVIPLYEDRMVGETVKYQIMAAGCMTYVDSITADIRLMINTPSEKMVSASESDKALSQYSVGRNVLDYVNKAEYYISNNLVTTLADIAYVNGGDKELISILNEKNMLLKINGYAGWNTSSNTLGTSIVQGVFAMYYKNTEESRAFMAERYYEDVAYCSYVRKFMCDEVFKNTKYNYFDSKEKRGEVSKRVKKEIELFSKDNLDEIYKKYELKDVYMPWVRMFEVGIEIEEK